MIRKKHYASEVSLSWLLLHLKWGKKCLFSFHQNHCDERLHSKFSNLLHFAMRCIKEAFKVQINAPLSGRGKLNQSFDYLWWRKAVSLPVDAAGDEAAGSLIKSECSRFWQICTHRQELLQLWCWDSTLLLLLRGEIRCIIMTEGVHVKQDMFYTKIQGWELEIMEWYEGQI